MNIIVYTTNTCPYCVSAKDWLKTRGYEFTEVNLGVPENRTKFVELYPGVRTVPQIVVDGERIGGYSELLTSKLA